MAANPKNQLSIDVEPELRQRIEREASSKNVSIQDYVVAVLRRATLEAEHDDDGKAWGQLSAHSFARDWTSDEDAVYDTIA